MSDETLAMTVDQDLVSSVRDLFATRSPHEAVATAEANGMSETLWTEVTQLGLHLVGVPEASGGSGGTLPDAVAILHAAGEFAVAAPIAESLYGGALLAAVGADVPEGLLTVAPAHAGSGEEVSGVPFARHASHVVAVDADGSVVLSAANLVRESVDLAGMPSDTVTLDGDSLGTAPPKARALGMLFRTAALAGAMSGAADLTLRYTQERQQFGRQIAQFQAVAQHNVTLAQMAAMTSLAAERAAIAAMRSDGLFEITAAKQIADKNATVAARAAHQAHGAIGMTQEYRLQQLTRRLYAWRGEYGDEKTLAVQLGAAIAAHGTLHDVITGGSDVLEVR